jgi:predicted NBD/HSP70 family sugar kinase
MEHFAGLDVSVKETSVCIVDAAGSVIREVKVASTPEALTQVLRAPAYRLKRVAWRRGRCRNGCSAGSAKRMCR